VTRLYTSEEAAKLAGISYRQLDHWTRLGVVKPQRRAEGSGSARRWAPAQIVELRVIAGLRRAGVSMQRVRRAVGWLRRQLPKVKTPLAELSFATDGQRIFYLSPNPGKLVDVLAGGQAVLTIPMEGMEKIAPDWPTPERGSRVAYDLPQKIELGEDGYFVAHCPALRGCWTQGKTREEAQRNLEEAIALYLEAVEAGEIRI
jgi:predicted RNase H-like HicB family nuclease